MKCASVKFNFMCTQDVKGRISGDTGEESIVGPKSGKGREGKGRYLHNTGLHVL